MGPGRLTGMNALNHLNYLEHPMSFNGARSIDRDERVAGAETASTCGTLQWGPVD